MQATLAAMEIESNVATWLYEQLGFVVPHVAPAPPPLLTNGLPAAPSVASPGSPHPTRPVDIVMLVLLGLNLRRAPLMRGGGDARNRG